MHCAANTGFHVPLDEILATNTVGFMELLKIAAGCKRLKVSLDGPHELCQTCRRSHLIWQRRGCGSS